MQHGKFGQKMAVAKYPASHGNASHIEISGLRHQNEADHANFVLNLRHTMNRCLHDS